jgi:hypothetical protein
LTAGHDSNVNSATAAGQFALPAFGGLLFTMDPDSRRQEDSFLGAAGGMGVQFRLVEGWTLTAEANARKTVNDEVHDMDTGVLDGTFGVSHTAGAHTQSIALQANRAWVSSSTYRTARGVTAQWHYAVTRASQASAFLQWTRLAYDEEERDADRTVVGVGYAHGFHGGATLLYGSVFAADEPAHRRSARHFGHDAGGLRLGTERRLASQWVAFGEFQYEKRRFDGTEPMFEVARRDRQSDAAVGLHFTPVKNWRLSPQLRHTHAQSNVVLYDYDRTIVQLTLRGEFP